METSNTAEADSPTDGTRHVGLRLISLVVPVYQEAENIQLFLRDVETNVLDPHETLIVYDFPEDNTLPAVAAMARLIRDGADVVAGSRYVRGGRQEGGPLVKRTLSRFAGMSLHYLAGLPIHDATNNFRAYSRRVIEQIPVEGEASFALALELTLKAHWNGWRIAEVPTTWRDRTAGRSRFRLFA